jgi:Spy/CpxP family protein refolding chaperone
MLRINLFKMLGVVLLAFIFLTGVNLYAQDNHTTPKSSDTQNAAYKQNAKKWTDQLNKKLSLTQEQQTQIQNILVDYQLANKNTTMDKNEQLRSTYNNKIESVLNDNQKSVFKSYKAEWWKGMSTSTKKENNNSY